MNSAGDDVTGDPMTTQHAGGGLTSTAKGA
jgi:hypothetical protein